MDRLQTLYYAEPPDHYGEAVNSVGIEQALNEVHSMLKGLIKVKIAELEEESRERDENHT